MMCLCCKCEEIERLERYVKLLEYTNDTIVEQKLLYADMLWLLESKLPQHLRKTLEDIGFWKNAKECMELIKSGKLVID